MMRVSESRMRETPRVMSASARVPDGIGEVILEFAKRDLMTTLGPDGSYRPQWGVLTISQGHIFDITKMVCRRKDAPDISPFKVFDLSRGLTLEEFNDIFKFGSDGMVLPCFPVHGGYEVVLTLACQGSGGDAELVWKTKGFSAVTPRKLVARWSQQSVADFKEDFAPSLPSNVRHHRRNKATNSGGGILCANPGECRACSVLGDFEAAPVPAPTVEHKPEVPKLELVDLNKQLQIPMDANTIKVVGAVMALSFSFVLVAVVAAVCTAVVLYQPL